MKSSAYWKQRFEDLDKSLLSMGDQYYYDEVEKQFRLATREIEKEISVWYKRLAANNDISMADAKALLAALVLPGLVFYRACISWGYRFYPAPPQTALFQPVSA